MNSSSSSSNSNNSINHNNATPKRRSNIPSLVAAIMASLTTGGTTYAFGLYAGSALKRTLHLAPSQVDTISTAFFFAGLLSWMPGLLADRFGTRLSIATGGLTGATALWLYWCVATQRIAVPHSSWLVPVLSALGIAIFLSNALVTGSVFKIIVMICGPGTKGSAVGVAKGYVGLGSGAYAVLFESIRVAGQSSLDFLPMAACFAMVCATLPALLLLPTKAQAQTDFFVDEASPVHFRTLFGSLLCMGVLVIGNSLMELFGRHDGSDSGHATDDLYSPNNNDTSSSSLSSIHVNATQVMQDMTTTGVSMRDAAIHVTAGAGAGADGGRNVGMALLLVAVWLGPILSLLCLPRRREGEVNLLPQHDDDDDDDALRRGNVVHDDEEASLHLHENGEDAEMMSVTSITKNAPVAPISTLKEKAQVPRVSESLRLARVGSSHSLNSSNHHSSTSLGNNNDESQEDSHLLRADPNNSATSLTSGGRRSRGSSPQRMATGAAAAAASTGPSGHLTTSALSSSASAGSGIHGSTLPRPVVEENVTLFQMLQTPSALFLVWTFTILVGAGTVETNNMGEMVEALGFAETVAPASLALFSVAQAIGRVATGAISEAAMNWTRITGRCWIESGVPRPFFLVVASVVGFLAHFILGVATNQGVFVMGSALAGFAFGMVWPLMVLIVGEIFGTAHAGANYLFYDGFSSAIGTLMLTKGLAQAVYESNMKPENANSCFGAECFRMTHMVVSVLALTCLGTSVALMYTSRRIYNKRSLHTA